MKTWLPIRPDYIIQNFSDLLDFLAEANFSNPDDGFLKESVEKLEELALDILDNHFSHKLGETIKDEEQFDLYLKIVSASLYASYKSGKEIKGTYVKLLDSLVIYGFYDDEDSILKIKEIVMAFATGGEILTFPYIIKDIKEDSFSPAIFTKKFLTITFTQGNPEPYVYDKKGCCIFEKDKVGIFPDGNPFKKDLNLKKLADSEFGTYIKTTGKIKLGDSEFKDTVANLNILMQSIVPPEESPKVLKQYNGDEEEIYIRVVNKDWRNFITCETLNPDYKKETLFLDLPPLLKVNPYFSISRKDLFEALMEDDVLNVNIIEKADGKRYFSLEKKFNNYYFDIDWHPLQEVEGKEGETEEVTVQQAIPLQQYGGGSRWLTEYGKAVNIKNSVFDQEIVEAINPEANKGIELKLLDVTTDKKGNQVFNGERVGEILDEMDAENFKAKIPKNIVADMVNYWLEYMPAYEEPQKEQPKLKKEYVRVMCHLLATRCEDLDIPFYERYLDMAMANMLAIISEESHDEVFCDFGLGYLRALWAFSRDLGNKWLKDFNLPESLDSIPAVIEKKQIVDILAQYKEMNYKLAEHPDPSLDVEKIQRLVAASNSLIGNISDIEINRIKKTISRDLGIESIFKESGSEKHCFGEENEIMEFKRSIVFPPRRRGNDRPNPDPDIQIWAILKTIDGFLNSISGGTLLIGVNDNGYADGIEDDIKWLRENGEITEETVDKYILYINHRVSHAFEAYRRKDEDSDITTLRLHYTSFPTDGKTVLSINILPYEFGCVKLKKSLELSPGKQIERPPYIKDAYIRHANSTEELTAKMREAMESEKRKVIKDNEKQNLILVQDAIENHRWIKLKNYESSTSQKDRTIKPLDLLPIRGLVVGVEQGKKDLRVFKLKRCDTVELTNDSFKADARKKHLVDPFNMLVPDEKYAHQLELHLDRFANLLIREIYPYAVSFITHTSDPHYPFVLKCQISDEKGVGAFCMSVLGHFKIVEGKWLEDYILNQCKQYMEGEKSINI